MRAEEPFDLLAFSKARQVLGLLSQRESLGSKEFFFLIRAARRPFRAYCFKTWQPLWQPYRSCRLQLSATLSVPTYYFQVNLAKMQPLYTTLIGARRVHKTFSTGCILHLHRISSKRDRRNMARGQMILRFFQRFFSRYFRCSRTTAVCLGYRRRYSFFLASALLPFIRRYASNLVFAPQALTGAFAFRRVKAIKKRIRKRLGIRCK